MFLGPRRVEVGHHIKSVLWVDCKVKYLDLGLKNSTTPCFGVLDDCEDHQFGHSGLPRPSLHFTSRKGEATLQTSDELKSSRLGSN